MEINGYTIEAGADLRDAILRRANLSGADLPSCEIPGGDLMGWKKLQGGVIARLRIPYGAKRTASLVGRKCRAEFAWVEELQGEVSLESALSWTSAYDSVEYRVGEIVRPDRYDDDIRVECTNGIHFFLTKEEAEAFS